MFKAHKNPIYIYRRPQKPRKRFCSEMEAQGCLPGFSLKNPLPRAHTISFSTTFQSNNRLVSFKNPHYYVNKRVLFSNRIECKSKSNGENLQNVVSLGQNLLVKDVRRKNLAVFVSGGGSNFKSIHEASVGGVVHGHVSVLVTNKPDCGGAEYARRNNIPVISFPKSSSLPTGLSSDDLVAALSRKFEIDFILLAGYLKLLPIELVRAYSRSILNIHPSLLPAFGGKGYYGMKVHKAVVASGARYSGPTVHFVDEHYDTGRILAQRVVPVLANDTAEELAARVLLEEHKIYVEATAALCDERIIWREDGVPLIQSKENPKHCY